MLKKLEQGMTELRDMRGTSAQYSLVVEEETHENIPELPDTFRIEVSAPLTTGPKGALSRVLFEARPYSTMLLSGAVMVAISGACRVRLPALLGHYLTMLARGNAKNIKISPDSPCFNASTMATNSVHAGNGTPSLEQELMWLLVLVTAMAICEGANRVFMTAAGESLVKRVRGQLFETLLLSGMETHEATPTGQLIEQLNMDVVNIRSAVRAPSRCYRKGRRTRRKIDISSGLCEADGFEVRAWSARARHRQARSNFYKAIEL